MVFVVGSTEKSSHATANRGWIHPAGYILPLLDGIWAISKLPLINIFIQPTGTILEWSAGFIVCPSTYGYNIRKLVFIALLMSGTYSFPIFSLFCHLKLSRPIRINRFQNSLLIQGVRRGRWVGHSPERGKRSNLAQLQQ